MPASRIIVANSAPEYAAGATLFQEYALELNVDLSFQNFDEELNQLTLQYGPPQGCLLLAVRGQSDWLGCTGIRKFEVGVAELKRMYVRPAGRGQGLGRRLLENAIREATTRQYQKLRLDTLPSMHRALRLYREYGFCEIPPYRYNPVPGTVYLEKTLPLATRS